MFYKVYNENIFGDFFIYTLHVMYIFIYKSDCNHIDANFFGLRYKRSHFFA